MVNVVPAVRRFGDGLLDCFHRRVVDGRSDPMMDKVVASVAHGCFWVAVVDMIALFQHVSIQAYLVQKFWVYLFEDAGVDIVLFLLGRLCFWIMLEVPCYGVAVEVVETCFLLVVYLGRGSASWASTGEWPDYAIRRFGRWLLFGWDRDGNGGSGGGCALLGEAYRGGQSLRKGQRSRWICSLLGYRRAERTRAEAGRFRSVQCMRIV